MSDPREEKDSKKSKDQLLQEVSELRKRVDELEQLRTEGMQDDKRHSGDERKYRGLFNKIGDPILIYDKDTHKFLECNEAATRVYGYSKEELMSMTPFDLHAKEDFEKVKGSLESGPVDVLFTYTHISKYGQRLSVEVMSDEINYEGHPAWINVVRDVTDRKQAEDSLVHDRDELEQRVKERTYQLEEINKQMKRELVERKKMEEELKKSFKTLRKTMEGVVHAMAIVVEARDPYTAGHQRRVAALACAIGKEMGLSIDKVEGIRVACLLHDIGKITIPIEILSKPGKLTETEFSFIKKHPQVGFDILKGIEFPWNVAEIVHQHHERIDGSGYPTGLQREGILMEAKILGVADVVEAMSSHRPYRPARGIDKALGEILQNRGVIYEPDVVNACIKIFAEKKFEFS
jgi:PAS domain S-box-containing protein/putative nucleotidyltransferase with HDIG domain